MRQTKRHLIPVFGGMKLDKITPSIIQDFINGLAPQLVNFKEINSINRRILQYGVLLQLIPTNPARDVILAKKQKKGRDAIKFIAPEDLKLFFDSTEKLSTRNYKKYFEFTVFKFLLATGCRFGEMVALNWSDIDLEERTVTINKTYSQELRTIGETKTKAGARKISMDTRTILMMKQYKNRQRLLFLEIGARAPSVVFSTPTREYIPRNTLQGTLDRRCKALDIPRFTFHAFRHTHASLLLNAGISYKELQYRLGHSNIAMTLDVYSHLSEDKEKEAVSYFEKALKSL